MKTIFAFLCALLLCDTSAFADSTADTNRPPAVLSLMRTGERVASTNHSGQVSMAKRGVLTIGKQNFPTIERIGVVSLKKGIYECFMEQQHTEDGKEKRKVFRIQTTGSLGHNLKGSSGGSAAILIHAANYAYQLTGCVAPGRSRAENGVNNSVEAMQEIFEACGGFVDGKRVLLVVRN